MKMRNVVNAVIVENGKVLTVKRGKEPYKEMYGFVGGKVEKNESFEEALIREVMEETNSKIEVIKFLKKIKDMDYDIYFYECKIISSSKFIPNSEIKEVKWLEISDFIDNLKKFNVENYKEVEDFLC